LILGRSLKLPYSTRRPWGDKPQSTGGYVDKWGFEIVDYNMDLVNHRSTGTSAWDVYRGPEHEKDTLDVMDLLLHDCFTKHSHWSSISHEDVGSSTGKIHST